MSKTIYYACKYAPLELFAGYGATFSALDPLAESFPAQSAAPTPTCAVTPRLCWNRWSNPASGLWC